MLHQLFGIRACSNIFSGAGYDLQGDIFSPPLKRRTDRILTQWYFKHYNHEDDMPFGHDVADLFTYPHIKYPQQNQIFPTHEIINFQIEGSIVWFSLYYFE